MSGTEDKIQDRIAPYNQEQYVPHGYKRTEVGVVPEDWEVHQLGEGIDLKSGHHVLAKFCNTKGDGFPYLTGPADFPNGNIVQTKFAINASTICDKDDILITVKGSGAGALVKADGRYCISRQLMAIKSLKWNSEFLYYSIKQNSSAIRNAAAGLIPGLSRQEILTQSLPFPNSFSEQRAIATALSDVDHLLESLDKLIAKKRAIKQAAMQELLTGKTRLPGFSGEWEKKRLGDVLRVCYGRSQSGIEKDNGRYPILATSGEIGRTDTPLYEKPSVLIGRKGTIDEPQYMDTPFWSVDTLFYTAIEPSNNARFIYYKFITIPWKNYNEASGVPSLHPNTIENILIDTPELEEQDAIVNILKDMDDDIEDLKKRRKKTQYVKQGMMQELLTGRTRLNLDFEGLKDGHDSKSGDQGNHNSDKRNETSRPY